MSAGTLTLTNNSAAVSGAGTAFSTELAAGDFIVVTVGGVPYTLPVKSVESATALTLVSVYTGPTQSGSAWSAVPRVALNMVTAALVAQSAEALRGLNYDKQNWQQLFSSTGTITVKLPDGSTYTGPAWNSFTSALNGKLDKSKNLEDIVDAAKARSNLSLKGAALLDVGTTENTVASGSDNRLMTVNGKTGGNISSQIVVSATGITPALDVPASSADAAGTNAAYRVANSGASILGYMATVTGQYFSFSEALSFSGSTQYWEKRSSGQTNSPLGMLAVQGSDVRIKDGFRLPKSGASERIHKIGICEFSYKGQSALQRGFIAQQMQEIDELYTFYSGKSIDDNGEEFEILNVNDRAVIADLITVVQELQSEVRSLSERINAA